MAPFRAGGHSTDNLISTLELPTRKLQPSSHGRGLRALFWDAVEAQGGTVVGVAAYDPKATDFPCRVLL